MARWSWSLPLVGGGETKFQPVYVGDVAEAIALSVDGKTKPGAVYELGGPSVMSFRECLEEMLQVIDRDRWFVTVPWWQARMMAWFLEFMPKPMMTRDQVELLKSDNVVSPEAEKEKRTLDGLGIQPRSTGVILPTYLWSYRPQGQFTRNKPA
jgi:NADH dehydrogenase